MLATSHNRLAAELVGIDVRRIMLLSFALSAALGALAGLLTAPITLTRYDVGIMLGLKGFCAAILGGLGSAYGALVGGLILGLVEQMSAGVPLLGLQGRGRVRDHPRGAVRAAERLVRRAGQRTRMTGRA
jgi:branched-subunit amino acid ABC-type transport system permease component